MDEQRAAELARGLTDLGSYFWAGEAEICRDFFSKPRSRDEHIRWLRLQVFKEMYGSGLHAHPKGIIYGLIDNLEQVFNSTINSQEDRDSFEQTLRVLQQEFNHYRLFADILEYATGQPLKFEDLRGYQLPEDKKLAEIRNRFRQSEGRLGEAAIAFTEGGGSGFFFEGMKVGGDPLLDRIARACKIVYSDEVEHGEHGEEEVESRVQTEEEWQKVREMVVAICQQRLRMRYDMFGLPISEARIQEITEGKIEPLPLPH